MLEVRMGIQRRVCNSALLSFLTCMEKLAVKRLKELVVADRRTVDVHALSLTTSLQQLQDVYITTPPNSHSGGSPSAATVTRAASPRRRESRCRWCPAGRPPSPRRSPPLLPRDAAVSPPSGAGAKAAVAAAPPPACARPGWRARPRGMPWQWP